MRFRVFGRQADCLLRHGNGRRRIAFLNQCIGQVDSGLREVWRQLQRSAKMRDGRVNFTLPGQYPTQRVMCIGASRREAKYLLKGLASPGQVSPFQIG